MSLQDEMQAAVDEYARRLDATAERDRLAALATEARNAVTTDEAANALGAMFAELAAQNDPDALGDTAEDTSTPTDNEEN